jgi:hypothetical protein
MTKENRDFVLLGIKYESAKIAGVSDAALERIAGQLREEVGEEWATDPMVVRGRDAVRREHGLDTLGAVSGNAGKKPSSSRSRWRIFGRRS